MEEKRKTIGEYDTVWLEEERHALAIIDQTRLPGETEILYLTEQKDIWNAIYLLQVRGAPAIGVAAGIAVYLAARQIHTGDYEEFYREFRKASDYLNSSRPTAVNLSWALKRQERVVKASWPPSATARPPRPCIWAMREAIISGSSRMRQDPCCRGPG